MKPSEIDLLKFWLDAEITLIHIMFAIVVWLLTHNWIVHLLLFIYIIGSYAYMLLRIRYVVSSRKDYLKVPR